MTYGPIRREAGSYDSAYNALGFALALDLPAPPEGRTQALRRGAARHGCRASRHQAMDGLWRRAPEAMPE